ncbi:MOSC domain-containing protein [Halorussus gelatinilyticus]|uniref:MOSC domain-containing protein n=1 Tax=Halorussus gelatinilyticus TaxID=2937524 RepID=A0A8U0IG42_9EURY|nr:MOSC N-terminal beta barrel domain-containing protein [Halorussus gelatinilyticus]UPV99847.1 MOSC domain-containing protein [Halorussus gelatinilyticus]
MSDWYGDHPVTGLDDADPHLAHLQYFPVKSLDPEPRDRATLAAEGALAGDREWAILDRPADDPYDPAAADVGGSGDYVNGKKTDAVHRLRSTFHPRDAGGPGVTLREQGTDESDSRRFALADAGDDEAAVHADLNARLSEFFGRAVSVRRDASGQHDDRERHGPTVVSTATLREVAAWFDFDLESARRRFRANVEVGGVPPFWEDCLFADADEAVRFRVGEVELVGIHPCQRCVVPGRDPDTGEETPDFREAFVRRREETIPSWTAGDRFDHAFRLMVNTRVPEESAGETVAVGDPVERLGTEAV